ncbi:hypothetical protein CHL67_02455 [Prosthecochloris sp. GSB1]|nr:hypothetical protein CHL67_02455 [Prosthecochloris sp. GSB1]
MNISHKVSAPGRSNAKNGRLIPEPVGMQRRTGLNMKPARSGLGTAASMRRPVSGIHRYRLAER